MAVYGKNIVQRAVCFLQAHPRTVLYPTAILTLVATVSAVDLTYNFSPEELFRGNDDLTEYRADFQKTFKLQKRVILLVLETKGREDLLTPINLTWMAEITKELLGVEGVEKVLAPTSLKEPKRNIVPFIPVMALPIIDEIPVTHEDALVLRGVIEKSGPLGQQWLSPNLKMGLVAIKIENGIQAIEAILTIVEAIESALHKHSPPQGLSWELSGLAAIRADVIRNLKNDQLTLVPLVTIIFILILRDYFS